MAVKPLYATIEFEGEAYGAANNALDVLRGLIVRVTPRSGKPFKATIGFTTQRSDGASVVRLRVWDGESGVWDDSDDSEDAHVRTLDIYDDIERITVL